MTADLDEVSARLAECLRAVASGVPDEPPPWDAALGQRAAPIDVRARRPRRAVASSLVAATVAAVATATALFAGRGSEGQGTVRAELTTAAGRALAAQTARVRLSSAPPPSLERSENAVPMTATGVVDFATPAMRASFPDGYSWIVIGNRSWQTVWPPTSCTAASCAVSWEVAPPIEQPPGTTAAERQLALALEPDTAPAALLAVLRSDTSSFADLGTGRIDGVAAEHYRATVGRVWRADVWVERGELRRVEVRGADGGWDEVDYSDFGVPVHIVAPALAR